MSKIEISVIVMREIVVYSYYLLIIFCGSLSNGENEVRS